MNYVGKIFIVLVTVMSFIFMSFALAAYATQRNWKAAIENAVSTAVRSWAGGQGGEAEEKLNEDFPEAGTDTHENLKNSWSPMEKTWLNARFLAKPRSR